MIVKGPSGLVDGFGRPVGTRDPMTAIQVWIKALRGEVNVLQPIDVDQPLQVALAFDAAEAVFYAEGQGPKPIRFRNEPPKLAQVFFPATEVPRLIDLLMQLQTRLEAGDRGDPAA